LILDNASNITEARSLLIDDDINNGIYDDEDDREDVVNINNV